MILTKLNELVIGNQITARQLTSRSNNLRSDHKIMSEILSLSGWGYDVDTGVSTTTELGKATYVAAHPEAAKFMHKLLPGFEVLNSMWMGTHAIGTYATSDGISRVSKSLLPVEYILSNFRFEEEEEELEDEICFFLFVSSLL